MAPKSRSWFSTINPSNEKKLADVASASKGDVDAGRTITADSSEVTMKIEESKGGSDDNDNSQSNDDSTEDGEEVVSNNWTPFWPGAVIIALLGAAFNRKE